MRGVYEASFKVSAKADNKSLMILTAPTGKVVEILSASVTNETNETNEQLECCISRITTLGSAAGTAVTPAPTEAGDQASGSTVLGGITTEPTTYSAGKDFGREGFASLAGWRYQPVPEERLHVSSAASIGIQMITAPALGAIDCEVRIVFREIG